MSSRRKGGGLFVCFGAGGSAGDPKEEAAGIRQWRRSQKMHRRILDKMIRSASLVASPKRRKKGKEEEESNRSETAAETAAESIFSSDFSPSLGSSSSTASSSSSSSSSSSASFPDPTETKPRPRRRPAARPQEKPPATAEKAAKARCAAATGVLLLLVSLSVMVFCGRIYAILLTSSSLCLAPRRIRQGRPTGKGVDRVSSPSFQRRKGKKEEEEEEEEKRRVVLEGLLERNRKL